jgi:hypothetical protein
VAVVLREFIPVCCEIFGTLFIFPVIIDSRLLSADNVIMVVFMLS